MKLIAHRGLMRGPNAELENNPVQIVAAIMQGFDVEIDVRIKDHQFYLGHDQATYEISHAYLCNPSFWIHAKDHAAAEQLSHMRSQGADINFFWHQSDDRTLTSHGYWWTQPGKPLTSQSIAVMPENKMNVDQLSSWSNTISCAGICSDYVGIIK